MATIKEFYINRFKSAVPDVETAFAWRLATIPKSERFGSTNFLVSYTVAFLGCLCAASAAGLLYTTWLIQQVGADVPVAHDLQPWIVGALVALIYLFFHVVYFRRALDPSKEQRQIKKAQKKVGGAER